MAYPLLDALGEAALLTDAEINLVAINRAAEELYEVTANSMIGRKLVDLIGTAISDAQDAGWAAILRGDVLRGVVWHQKPNRQRFRAEVSARAIFDQTNTFQGLIAIVKDVTERESELLRQRILSDCLRALGNNNTSADLYQIMLESLTAEAGADAAVFRIREANGGYRILAATGVDLQTLEPIEVSEFKAEEPFFLRGETVLIDLHNTQIDTKYNLIKNLGFREAHLVGQRVAGELIGSIALVYRQKPWVDLRPILPEVAAALGSRLQRERNLEQLERERVALEVLAQVSRDMRLASTSAELYQIATDFALRATRAESSFVLIANADRSQLHPMAGSGLEAEVMLQKILTRERGLSWQVLDSGVSRIESISKTLDQAFAIYPIARGSFIGLPIRADTMQNSQVIGVLTADTQASGIGFEAVDLDILTAITEALSSALARLHALETAQTRAEAFAKLAQLSSDLEQLEDVQSIAALGLQTLLDVIGLDTAVYFTFDGTYLQPLAVLGDLPDGYMQLRTTTPITVDDAFGRTTTGNRVLLIPDAQIPSLANTKFQAFGFRTALIAPVILNGQTRAFLSATTFGRTIEFPASTREITEFLAGRLARAMERADAIQEIMNTRAQAFRALGLALELRDFETKGHTDRVVQLSLQLGESLGLSADCLQALEWGALLHDIGKIAVPDHVLLKPEKLNPDEWLWIRQHPRIGFDMLAGLNFLPKETLDVVLYHQERTDGSGYPDNKKLEDIPYLARVFAVVDVYDALTSDRPYKAAWTESEAVQELQRQAGLSLDANIVQVFLEILRVPVNA